MEEIASSGNSSSALLLLRIVDTPCYKKCSIGTGLSYLIINLDFPVSLFKIKKTPLSNRVQFLSNIYYYILGLFKINLIKAFYKVYIFVLNKNLYRL